MASSKPMEHEDFVIVATGAREIKEAGQSKVQFRVQVPGRVTEGQETGYDAGQLLRLTKSWEIVPPSLPRVVEVGQMLGQALLPPGPVREAMLASLAAHRNQPDSRLRILLILEPALQAVPWEFALFHTEQGEATQNEILGLMSQVSIARQLDRTLPDLQGIRPAALPAQMVVALADPAGSLDLEEERRLIREALDDVERVQVRYVEPATADNLLGGLERVDLYHFAGHGTFVERPTPGAAVGQGALVLDDGSGNEDPLEGPQLASRLVRAGVRVAVLGACLTARRDEVDLWSSTAANLINGGLGAVVGMQYVVRDDSAIAFARAFYGALALGYPVDQALTKGRIAIFEQGDYRGFGTPVLYMGGSDGVVLPELTHDPALAAERDATRVVVNLSVDIVEGEVTGIEVARMTGGEARATVSAIELKNGQLTGMKAGTLTGGSAEVQMTIDRVGAGSRAVGYQGGDIGPAGPDAAQAPSAATSTACPNCGRSVEAAWKTCPYCGVSLQRAATCPGCGREVQAGWRACPYCGIRLGA